VIPVDEEFVRILLVDKPVVDIGCDHAGRQNLKEKYFKIKHAMT